MDDHMQLIPLSHSCTLVPNPFIIFMKSFHVHTIQEGCRICSFFYSLDLVDVDVEGGINPGLPFIIILTDFMPTITGCQPPSLTPTRGNGCHETAEMGYLRTCKPSSNNISNNINHDYNMCVFKRSMQTSLTNNNQYESSYVIYIYIYISIIHHK